MSGPVRMLRVAMVVPLGMTIGDDVGLEMTRWTGAGEDVCDRVVPLVWKGVFEIGLMVISWPFGMVKVMFVGMVAELHGGMVIVRGEGMNLSMVAVGMGGETSVRDMEEDGNETVTVVESFSS